MARARPNRQRRVETEVEARVLDQLQTRSVGEHIAVQSLADALGLSRTPISSALAALVQRGVVTHAPRRGYFIANLLEGRGQSANPAPHNDARAYLALADDVLKGAVRGKVSETYLQCRYNLTRFQLKAILARIVEEGWVQKRPGYGWAFSKLLSTPESLIQSYRLRLALEPAALLEPGYSLPRVSLDACRAAELHLLDGGIETASPDQLHERGVRFHETLVEASGNPFFIDTIRRVNRVRRLLSYRSMQDRGRYEIHCRQHLKILDLLEAGQNREASEALRVHLAHTLSNLQKILPLLNP